MASKANVHYELTADESRAVDAFRKLSREQQKSALQFGKTAQASENMGAKATKAAKSSQTAMAGLGKSVKSVAGMLGVGLGGISLGAALTSVVRSIGQATDKTIAFEREMTGLLSLGENVRNIDALRTEVLDLAVAYRESTAGISDFLFGLQSSSANLDPGAVKEIREQSMELSEVTGTDLATSLTALMKAYQIYGKEVENVDRLQNKLFISAERGWMTFEELGTLLPDVAASAKTFGYSLDELLGALSTATRLGGKNEKTFTGLRNVLTRMSKAAEEGVPLTGDLVADLTQLGRVDPETLKRIFGEEAVSIVAILRDNVTALVEDIQQLSSTQSDLVKQRKELRETDPQYAFARRMEQARASVETATLRGGGSETTRDLSLYYEEARRGWREVMPTFLHGWLEYPMAGLTAALSGIAGQATGYSRIGQEAIMTELSRSNLDDAVKYMAERRIPTAAPSFERRMEMRDIFAGRASWGKVYSAPSRDIINARATQAFAGPEVLNEFSMLAPAAGGLQQSADNLAAASMSLRETIERQAQERRAQDRLLADPTGQRRRMERITNLNAGVG